MHKLGYGLLALPLMLLAAAAQAQTAGTITFSANQTSATGSLTPVLTWSTSPVASSCQASGGWSGTKFASGSETLPTITANTSYTLTCSWGTGSTTLNWKAPTTNSNGTALTDLASYKVLFGTSSNALSQSMSVADPKATSATITSLGAGTWYFAVRTVNSAQVESVNSNVAQKTIGSASASKTVAITITAATPPPNPTPPPTTTLQTVGTRVYDVVYSGGQRLLGRQVGTVALGVACNPQYPTNTNYYPVLRSTVTFTRTSRTNTVVARCALK